MNGAILSIRVTMRAGCDIADAARALVDAAIMVGCKATADFGGVELEAVTATDPCRLVSQYWQATLGAK